MRRRASWWPLLLLFGCVVDGPCAKCLNWLPPPKPGPAPVPRQKPSPMTSAQMLDYTARRLQCPQADLHTVAQSETTSTVEGCGKAISFVDGNPAMEWSSWPADAGG